MFGWETELKGSGSTGIILTVNYTWDFVAEVPK
jgi:hypothetical protein